MNVVVASSAMKKKAQEAKKRVGSRTVESNEDLMARLKESFFYLCFLTVFMAVVINRMDARYSYLYSAYMKDLLLEEEFLANDTHIKKTFWDVATEEEFWQWMKGPFVIGLFDTERPGFVYGTSRLVGATQLRQVRVRSSCSSVIADSFKSFVGSCYPEFTDKYESKESYGKKNGWKWQSQRELGTRTTRARHNRYPGSGFATELSPLSSLTEAAAVVADLREGGWVDLHTRAVFVNFALYNGNINEFLVGKVYFEFLPSGGVVPGFDFDVLNLSSYAGDRGRRLLVCEVVLVLFIIFYTAEEIKELWEGRLEYLKDYWNFVDSLNMFLFVVIVCLRFASVYISATMKGMPLDGDGPTHFMHFERIIGLVWVENVFYGFNGILLWVKIFKYSTFFVRTQLIVNTVNFAFLDICVFIVMFFIVLMGFATGGYILFGHDVAGYERPDYAVITLFRMVLGDFEVEALRYSSPIIGPLFFFLFVVSVGFIVLSMFISIVNDAYSEARVLEKEEQERTARLYTMIRQQLQVTYTSMAEYFNRKETATTDLEAALKARADTDNDNYAGKREVLAIFREHLEAFDGEEVQEIFDMFDIDGDAQLDAEEQAALMAEIAKRKERLMRARESAEAAQARADDEAAARAAVSPSRRLGLGRQTGTPVGSGEFCPHCGVMGGDTAWADDAYDDLVERVKKLENATIAKMKLLARRLEILKKLRESKKEETN